MTEAARSGILKCEWGIFLYDQEACNAEGHLKYVCCRAHGDVYMLCQRHWDDANAIMNAFWGGPHDRRKDCGGGKTHTVSRRDMRGILREEYDRP